MPLCHVRYRFTAHGGNLRATGPGMLDALAEEERLPMELLELLDPKYGGLGAWRYLEPITHPVAIFRAPQFQAHAVG